jgi:hypothetical protein
MDMSGIVWYFFLAYQFQKHSYKLYNQFLITKLSENSAWTMQWSILSLPCKIEKGTVTFRALMTIGSNNLM